MEEVWSPIFVCKEESAEGVSHYEVSNLGNVRRSAYTGFRGKQFASRLVHAYKNPNGYLVVKLSYNGKVYNFHVHRLVAMEFIRNTEGYYFVWHKDGNRQNNRADNLEWRPTSPSARSHNVANAKPVRQYTLDGKFVAEYPSVTQAARKLGISPSPIARCCNRAARYKQSNGYIWRFVSDDEFFVQSGGSSCGRSMETSISV